MKQPKVRLYIRIRSTDGKDMYVDPAWNKNHTLREGYAVVKGKPEHHPEWTYYLRHAKDGKRVWSSVGKNAALALVALRNREHDLQATKLGRVESGSKDTENSPPTPSSTASISVSEATVEYLNQIRSSRAAKTIAACEDMLGHFCAAVGTKMVSKITRNDLMEHMDRLRLGGRAERTVFNHIARVNTLLKRYGNEKLLRPEDWPAFDEKEVSVYSLEELDQLFHAATPDERLLFQFFLTTGFREGEVMHATWADLNLRDKMISIRVKPRFGFRPKDKGERTIPIPDSIIQALAEHKRTSKSILIFPTRQGKPDGHFLRRLQRIAFRAGLNCGECVTRGGEECASKAVCRRWGLHEFRRTFATLHSEGHVAPPTIQRWLGHSDLATTLRYIEVADNRSEKTRAKVNASFAELQSTAA